MSVTAPEGFVATGIHAGIKDGDAPDLALVATDDGVAVPAAGVFTRNRMIAAPVVVSRAHLRTTAGHAAAVLLNSGNANAATGEPGVQDTQHLCGLVAAELGCDHHHVLMCSTGLIGFRLPLETMSDAVPGLAAACRPDGGAAAAQAILTTDTVAKEVTVEGDGFTLGAMAKGAAMLAPNLATMLAVLTTDAQAEPATLEAALRDGVADTFNTLIVDGATSTNDTVLLLAGGRAGPVARRALDEAVHEACRSLAQQMAADAEGHTKVVRVHVTGATSDAEADTAARAVATSQLTKCSWYGEDPYWGRVASDVGSAGVHFDPECVSVAYGDTEVCRRGTAVDHDVDAVAAHLAGDDWDLRIDLGLGAGRATILTNDLTHAYIDENRGTS